MPISTQKHLKLQWSLNVAVEGGPNFMLTSSVPGVSAIDVIRVEIAAEAADQEVALQPGTTDGSILFMTISADKYDLELKYTVDCSYLVNPGNPVGPYDAPRELDAPHVFLGAGAVKLLRDAPPRILHFHSGLMEPVTVQIVIGRTAEA